MSERVVEAEARITDLRVLTVGPEDAKALVVLAHGFEMTPEDLSPFARSLGADARFYFPEAPLAAETRGRAFWPIDLAARAAALTHGPRDLAGEHPPGLPAARARFAELVVELEREAGDRPIVVGGFSQGGMLTMDTLLRGGVTVDAAVLLSTSRIAWDEWQPHAAKLAGLPVLIAHGRADADLSFAAGDALRAFLVDAGADVTWVPHDAGHQIPLPVWRQLRRFLAAVTARGRTRPR
ncbi:MAG: hypothetical protein U0235_16685 [Polyangiaceae bacterium]